MLAWNVLARGRYSFVYDQMPVTMQRMSWAKRVNLFRSGGNLVYRRTRGWSMPLHIQLELTNFCNLRCPVCPTGIRAVERKPQAIDPAFFEDLIDEIGPYLLTTSLWAWGEPLLHPNLERILRAIRKHDIAILLSTNGQKLNDPKVIEALVNEPPTYLIVAIDGLTDETNTEFRKGAKLAPALEGVRKIAEIKRRKNLTHPVLHMRYIVMKHNQHEVPNLVGFARDHGFDLLTERTLAIIDASSSHDTHCSLVPDIGELRAYDYDDGARIHRSDYICQEPFWFPTVFADGTLVPCEQDFNATQTIGVLSAENTFADLWYSDRAREVRRTIRDTPEKLSFCVNCPYRDREQTDVSAKVHFLNREIDYESLIGHTG